MEPQKRQKSPRFMQSEISNVFTDVIKTMSDQRNTQPWNRKVATEFSKQTPRSNTSRSDAEDRDESNGTPRVEITRLASGL